MTSETPRVPFPEDGSAVWSHERSLLALALSGTALALAAVLWDWWSGLRLPLVLLVLGTAPGYALTVVLRLRLHDLLVRAVVVVGSSLALDVLLARFLLSVDRLDGPSFLLVVLAAILTAAASTQRRAASLRPGGRGPQ